MFCNYIRTGVGRPGLTWAPAPVYEIDGRVFCNNGESNSVLDDEESAIRNR